LQLQPTYFAAARNLAMLDFAENKPNSARQRYEAVLAKDPKNEEALLGLAELLQLTHAPAQETAKTLERAVSARPDSVQLRLVQINFLRQLRDGRGALAAAQQADAFLPDNPQILEVLGRTELEAGAVSQAIATFGKLVHAFPKSAAPLMLQAEAYLAAKNEDAALQALKRAIEVQPGLVAARKNIALLQIKAGRYDLALTQARAIQEEVPRDPLGYLLEASVLTAQKREHEAERLLIATLKRTPAPSVVFELYDLMSMTGRATEATAIAERWIRENPKDVEVLQYVVEKNLRNRDYKSAVPRLKVLLARQPRDALTLNNLAWALGQLKDPEALRYAEEGYPLAPDSPTMLDTLGWLLVEGGDTARGLELLRKASRIAPNAHAIRLHFAQALLKSGQKDDARKELLALAGLPGASPVKETAIELLSTL
jgi:putative PEP-CTERM system TPR-repeat lipoprotein